jgi:hypothetical protein|tara:strand:+ start:5205 stop:5399 length:195 start_codon:yes stop_codon:yes gene_type:complete
MDDVKGLLQSKTIWATLIAITSTILQLTGFELGDTNGLAEQVTALVACIIAIYGRITAVKRIAK